MIAVILTPWKQEVDFRVTQNEMRHSIWRNYQCDNLPMWQLTPLSPTPTLKYAEMHYQFTHKPEDSATWVTESDKTMNKRPRCQLLEDVMHGCHLRFFTCPNPLRKDPSALWKNSNCEFKIQHLKFIFYRRCNFIHQVSKIEKPTIIGWKKTNWSPSQSTAKTLSVLKSTVWKNC